MCDLSTVRLILSVVISITLLCISGAVCVISVAFWKMLFGKGEKSVLHD